MSSIEDYDGGCLIHVHVRPGSSKQEIILHQNPLEIRVFLKQRPERGKANKELVKLFRKFFKGYNVSLISGMKSSAKIIEIKGISSETAQKILFGNPPL